MFDYDCEESSIESHIPRGINSPTTTDMSANFLSLPSELRNKIYEQVLVDQEYIALTSPRATPSS